MFLLNSAYTTTCVLWHAFCTYKWCKHIKTRNKDKEMIRKLFLVIVMNAFVAHAGRCQTMSMDECMAYAVEHAAEVGRQQYHLANATWEYRSSVASLFPSVSASVAGAANFGRSIDPETNNYTTVSTIGNQYGVSGSMPLFVGMRQVNAVRLAKTGKLLGMHQVEIARVQAAAAAMDAYIEALYYKEMTAIAQKQVDDASALLQKTEKHFGRPPNHRSDESRTLDCDLIFFNDLVISTLRLTVPHPRMHQRAFVLELMVETAPDFIHPVLKKSVRELFDDIVCK